LKKDLLKEAMDVIKLATLGSNIRKDVIYKYV